MNSARPTESINETKLTISPECLGLFSSRSCRSFLWFTFSGHVRGFLPPFNPFPLFRITLDEEGFKRRYMKHGMIFIFPVWLPLRLMAGLSIWRRTEFCLEVD